MGRYRDNQPEFRERSDRSSRRYGGRDRNRNRRDNREGGFRERSGGFDRNREMHDVVCDKCGKECQVPFKPSTNKPVFCDDCFRKDDSGNRRNFDSRSSSGQSQPGISPEQFNKLNAKLDRIIEILESFEEEEIEDEE